MDSLNKFAEATNNDIYDQEYNGGQWMVEAVETQETIDNFIKASNNYYFCTKEKFGEIAGFKFVAFKEVQAHKELQRRPLSIIDFGEMRFALMCDLTDYT